LGRFCNEKQYGDAVEKYLKELKIEYEREKILPLSFEQKLRARNKIDFLIENKIILEIKAKRLLTRDDYYQGKRYLASLNKKLGLLVNFRDKYIKPKRILNSLVKD
jgi:GxxExxY protein